MPHYEWYNQIADGQVPPSPPTLPTWWHTNDTPGLALFSPSPVGEGDKLVRTEFSATIALEFDNASGDSFIIPATIIEFAGDVGPLGGPIPDPLGTGVGRFALTASTDQFVSQTSQFGPTAPTRENIRWTTRGYVTSKAIRSAADYGAIAPYFNMGVTVKNGFNLSVHPTLFQMYWLFILRTLWLVP